MYNKVCFITESGSELVRQCRGVRSMMGKKRTIFGARAGWAGEAPLEAPCGPRMHPTAPAGLSRNPGMLRGRTGGALGRCLAKARPWRAAALCCMGDSQRKGTIPENRKNDSKSGRAKIWPSPICSTPTTIKHSTHATSRSFLMSQI